MRATLASAPAHPEAAPLPRDEDEKAGEPRSVGLAGGPIVPVVYEAKDEMSLPSRWPKRAAILRTETEGPGPDSKRITQRRVYLRQ